MNSSATVEHVESPCIASTALIQSPISAKSGISGGSVDVARWNTGTEPPPLDWQSLVIGCAFILACLCVLASLVR